MNFQTQSSAETKLFNFLSKSEDENLSLPVRILLRPIKKRFVFHFTGPRQTARIDRPEWFLTQTLTWVKSNRTFIHDYVQPVADKLEMKRIDAVVSVFLQFRTLRCHQSIA